MKKCKTMNFFKRPIALLLLLLILGIKGQQQDLTLTPNTPAYVEQGNAINLTCKSTTTRGVFTFYHNKSGKQINFGIAGGSSFTTCVDYNVSNVQLHCEFDVEFWIFVLTFSKPMHNQTIFCSRQLTELKTVNSTIYVEVPVPKVILSPNDTVEVIENQNMHPQLTQFMMGRVLYLWTKDSKSLCSVLWVIWEILRSCGVGYVEEKI